MFPSQGFFFSTNCPDFLQGKCSRAYCHFHHNEKLRKSSNPTQQLNVKCGHPSSKTQQIINTNDVKEKQDLDKSKVIQQSRDIDISQQTSLNVSTVKKVATKNVEESNSVVSNDTSPDLLTQLISDAVKKVLSENPVLNSSAIDPTSIIKNLNTTSIVSKAVQEISIHQVEDTRTIGGKKHPKLYLPPPGTPSYQPTPIKELNNKNKPKVSDLSVTSQEYTPTPINCSANIVTNDGQVTDFSSEDDDENDQCDARSDFDMLEEVLVEKLSSNPLRSKAIQRRKKALGRMAKTSISSTSLQSSTKITSTDKTLPIASSSESVTDSESSFLPPSPVFTSSAYTCTNLNSHDQKSYDSPLDSPVDSPVDSSSKSPVEFEVNPDCITATEKSTSQSNSVSSIHNLLPQIAELSRPNTKSWSPVAKVDSLLSVEKMLEKLDRIDASKNIKSSNDINMKTLNINKTLTSKSKEQQQQQKNEANNQNKKCSELQSQETVRALAELSEKEPNKMNNTTNEKEQKNVTGSRSRKRSSESADLSGNEGKRKKSQDERIDSSQENETHKRSSNARSRSQDSNSSSDNVRKRKRSISSKKKKKHKRRYSSSEDSSSSETEEENCSEEDDSDEKHLKRKRKHKKTRSKRSKDRRKRSKHERSRSHKRKYTREKKSHSKSSDRSDSHNSDSEDEASQSKSTDVDKVEKPLTSIQIKQEKIDVDLSIVKLEKDVCKNSDNFNLINKQLENIFKSTSPLHSKSKNSSDASKRSTELLNLNSNLGDKGTRLTIKTEKGTSKSSVDKAINDSSSVSLTEAKNSSLNKNLEKNFTLSNKTENSYKRNATHGSCSTSKLQQHSFPGIDKLSENASINKILTKPGENLTKTLIKSSSKSKLDNYTSSLLLKVSDSLPCPSNSDSESTKSVSLSSKEIKHRSPKSSKGFSSKSNILKEISIFEDISEPSVRKLHSKSTGSSESKSASKTKGKSDVDKKKRRTFSQSSSHAEEGKEEKKSRSSHHDKHKDKEERSFISKHSHHSSHKRKHDERRSSNDTLSNSPKSSKLLKEDKEKRKSHESHKLKSLNSKVSSSRRLSETDRQISKDSKSGKSSQDKNKSTEKHLRDKTSSKSNVSLKERSEGSDSPIPDLSVLDELPKEDWDKLLLTPGNKIDNSDSDEGVDIDQSFEGEDIYDDTFNDDGDNEDINDPRVLEECMKVFSEYDPEKSSQNTVIKKDSRKTPNNNENDATNIVVPTRRNRVAYSGAAGNLVAKPKALIKPRRKTPAEIMLERYKKLKEEEAALQKKLELQRKELAKHGRLPHNLAISSSSVSSSSDKKASSHPVVASSSNSGKKRISIASSRVNALIKSKELLRSSISGNDKRNASGIAASSSSPAPAPTSPMPTAAMTNAKGAKRIAHTPKLETLERPIISTEEGTKVPQNIRQRYLNCFIDETIKFCDGDLHAHNVALAEESICHKRATTRMVYLNLAVNTVKKLRSTQISEAALVLLEKDPKYENTKEKRISNTCVVSPSPSTSFKSNEHPINPNHRTVSHFSVMASGGQKGSWSIQKPKNKLPDNIKDYLTGIKFYKCLKKYILSVEQLEENCFPRPDPKIKGKAILKKINTRKKISPNQNERYCDRCSILYEVDTWGLPIQSTSCVYHWGRAYKCRGIGGMETKYSCCQGDGQSEGCCLGTTHVSENFSPDFLTGYVRTIPKSPNSSGDYGVYALDCEMCYTTAGSELTRITVTDTSYKSVYETLVKPENPIIDYNTRFSGITESDMEGVTVRLRDVQAALLTRFSDKTILMGHSLESDFSALKIIHDCVVDTSVVFPHKLGSPYKRALRNLASEYLSKIIQNDEGGHDSAEDSNTCMQLMHWKIKEDLKGQV